MELRRLNEEGIRRMEAFLDSLTTESPEQCPESILTDAATSEALNVSIEVDRQPFPRRFELAQYLNERLTVDGLREPERDAGLWAWLALFWFHQLCTVGPDGRPRPGERARWIPRIDSARRYYRHLALGPYLIYAAHAEESQAVEAILCDAPFTATSEIYRLVAENPRLLSSNAVLCVIRELYYNPHTERLYRGAGRKERGGLRRLVAFLDQLDRTYDLQSLEPSSLLRLLPEEFEVVRTAAPVARAY